MRYFFFVTSHQDRGKGTMDPTLRALPGQTFDDGTPVDTDYNVRAPKEPGTSANGCRLEYPDGTIFCSSFLEEVTNQNGKSTKPFYSVYDQSKNQALGQNDPDFHPVSDDPNFKYVSPQHKSDTMNNAYLMFKSFKQQEFDDSSASATSTRKKKNKKGALKYVPYDQNGNARGPIPGWEEAYDKQVETETGLIVSWMKKTLQNLGVRTMATRPRLDDVMTGKVNELYKTGETINTIASTNRFNAVMNNEKMDNLGLSNISKGPFAWYLDELLREHSSSSECTAVERSEDNSKDMEDIGFLLCTQLNQEIGATDNYDTQDIANIKKAVSQGWDINTMLQPEILLSTGQGIKGFVSALADGSIALPASAGAPGNSLIDTLMKNPKNKCPKDKDGFHVDPMTWKLLVRNLYRRKNTMLIGPTGSGKTQLVQLLCKQAGVDCTIVQMGTITDPTEQLVGKMDLDPSTNGTKFDWADFALAIQRPGVIVLDEINRIPRNGDNILFSVLDDTRSLSAAGAKSQDNRTVQVHPDCCFIATANIGADYTGTKEIDAAMMNRFFPMELDYLDYKTEANILCARTGISDEDAMNIALVATNIRKDKNSGLLEHSVSTRETLQCAEMVKDGFTVEEALEYTFLPHFEGGITANDPNCERGKVRTMIATRLNSSK